MPEKYVDNAINSLGPAQGRVFGASVIGSSRRFAIPEEWSGAWVVLMVDVPTYFATGNRALVLQTNKHSQSIPGGGFLPATTTGYPIPANTPTPFLIPPEHSHFAFLGARREGNIHIYKKSRGNVLGRVLDHREDFKLPWQGFEGDIVTVLDTRFGIEWEDDLGVRKARNWRDQGPRHIDIEALGNIGRPTVTELNGKPSLHYGGRQRTINSGGLDGLDTSPGFTFFVVGKFNEEHTANFNLGFFALDTNYTSLNSGLSFFHEATNLTVRSVPVTGPAHDLDVVWANDGKAHIFECFHSNTLKVLYVDGVEIGRAPDSRVINPNIKDISLGMIGNSVYPLEGDLQSFLLFNRPFTPEERLLVRTRISKAFPGIL